jgi:uncharacterized damage-inducible protein DinB
MLRPIQDSVEDWACETGATLEILDALTPELRAARATPGGLSLADLVWHLVVMIPEMMNRTGLSPDGSAEGSTAPTMAQGTAETCMSATRQLTQAVGRVWRNASLEQAVQMYGRCTASCGRAAKCWRQAIRRHAHHRAGPDDRPNAHGRPAGAGRRTPRGRNGLWWVCGRRGDKENAGGPRRDRPRQAFMRLRVWRLFVQRPLLIRRCRRDGRCVQRGRHQHGILNAEIGTGRIVGAVIVEIEALAQR